MSATTISLEIADPYAQALMALAQDQNLEDQFGESAQEILDLLSASEELDRFLSNPLVAEESKKGVLEQISTDLNPLFKNFLKLLVDKGRIGFIAPILKRYQELLRQLRRTVLAEVTAAVELSEAQQDQIRQKVVAMTDAQHVDLAVTIDPTLLGGVIIKVGSQVVDASLRGQLRRLSMQLI
ncbi:ATP synthase F1 subunit delta [Leptolyngbya iicbica]|uniref:ATP synthase subunit delta n=2 Tax=Cyanophyceae TaxID=3028117 RepID=A0A4V2E3H3_9CYAN|nr:ATP synthase F1 subunit delta [Leptolyngbya sp. LK]RZM82440.1 F0F1 ATP synthase subunit delta [Leptolyngbya sp. LK]